MKLIVGLGNPGAQYRETRHNIGFQVLDLWASRRRRCFTRESVYDYSVYKDTVLIKPNTFMNRSGDSVREACRRWSVDDYLIICDDLELPLASVRVRTGGGDGGHNGIKSLAEQIAPEEMKRIRIGIGRAAGRDPADYVLEPFTTAEHELLEPVLVKAGEFIDLYIRYDFKQVLNEYSKWKKSYSDSRTSGIISPKEESNDQGL